MSKIIPFKNIKVKKRNNNIHNESAQMIIPKGVFTTMNRILELRKEKKMSQISLGMYLNISQKMISSYENEKNEPSIAMLKELASLFHTSIDYLVGYSNVRQPLDTLLQSTLSQEEMELLNQYRQFSKEKRLIAQGVLLGLTASEKEETTHKKGTPP